RLLFERLDHDGFDAVVADLARCAASRLVAETVQPVLGEALTPRADRLARDPHGVRDLAVVLPVGGPQDDLGALRFGPGDLAAPDTSLKNIPLIGRESDRTCHPPRHAIPRFAMAQIRNHTHDLMARN